MVQEHADELFASMAQARAIVFGSLESVALRPTRSWAPVGNVIPKLAGRLRRGHRARLEQPTVILRTLSSGYRLRVRLFVFVSCQSFLLSAILDPLFSSTRTLTRFL